MEVPGIRRVRSRSFRGATEISAQFDAPTDMVVALQQVQNRIAEIRGDLPADTDLAVERLTPAAFPVLILSLTGPLPTPDLHDYAFYVMRPALARVAGVGRVEVLASDTREIEVMLDPGACWRRRADRCRRRRRASSAEHAGARRDGQRGRAVSTSCSRRALGRRRRDRATPVVMSRTARRSASRTSAR